MTETAVHDRVPDRGVIFALRVALRLFVSVAVLLALYYLLPMDSPMGVKPVLGLAIGIVVFSVLVCWQVRAIMRSSAPGLRAVEALAFSIPLLIIMFATTYFLIAQAQPAAFSEHLTRTDSLYFTVTTFSTVGFGDITPRAQFLRLVVAAQMIFDLLFFGIGLRIIIAAVQRAKERGPETPAAG